MRTRISVLVLVFMVVILVAVIAGCGSRSPYVGEWNDYFAISESKMIFKGDGTGSASGFIFGDSVTFKWHEEGDHVVIEDWQGRSEFNYAKIASDGKTLRASGPGGHNPFYKVEKK